MGQGERLGPLKGDAMAFSLEDFVRESNRVEGILREPTFDEIEAHTAFQWYFDETRFELQRFVAVVTPGKYLRSEPGMDVRVGNHIAPPGGPEIVARLDALLRGLVETKHTPYEVHREYEALHPFMGGNGRSGRILWLWMMGGIDRAPLGFLHHWYYQSLDAQR